MIEFISHEYFPDDPYTKEICYLSVDSKFRFAYVRKNRKDGGLFWSPMSTSVSINGEKKFRHSLEWDSNFLAKDIMSFLEARSWESKSPSKILPMQEPISSPNYQQASFFEECPF